jgi:3-carboxy-cis,cis-muconate cycloisomerase
MAEAVMMGLAPQIGRNHAHKLVQAVANRAIDAGLTLREGLLTEPEVTDRLSKAEIDALLEPANYTGSAGAMVDAVIARYESMRPTG